MPYSFSKNNVLSLIFFALIALALGIGFNMWTTAKRKISLPSSGTRISKLQELPEFHLVDGSDHPFTNHSLKGHYNILFFGYTHCQGICPMTMTMLTQLYAQLKKDKLPLPQITFITLDPKRDKQQVVADYVKAFNTAFKGVTGPLMGIQQLSKQMGVVYIKAQQDNPKDNNYQIDHSGTLYLINPKGQLIAVFSPPHEKDAIVRDYKELLRA
ncbi:MAG: SCO family protein [Rickettsiella sp.]|nr:SCO family protein [Rickettsiella sp.]